MTARDGADEAFQKALAETRRSAEAAERDGAGGLPHAKALPLDLGQADGGGGEARWGLAMSWTSEADETGAHPPAPVSQLAPVGPDAESIAAELGIGASPTEAQLTRRWRAFLWRNHPDRHPAHARSRANARVAIANSLYQQARRQLTKRG